MTSSWVRRASLILIQLLFLSFATLTRAQQPAPIAIATPQQIAGEFQSVPCQNEDRLGTVESLFKRMGASPSEVSEEKFKNVENLVIRKEGLSQEIIVVGAHYDKVRPGCGALDNWTGIVTLAYLYKSLKDVPLKKTVLFVAFGREEDGLIGSRAMVRAIPKQQVSQYCAMINLDSFGLGRPQVDDTISSKKLEVLAAGLAQEMKMLFGHAPIEKANADSSPFLSKKIPAITLHGLTNQWPTILHSPKDVPSTVQTEGVYLGYRLALAMLSRVNSLSCDAFR
jgi:hypothetical protein